MTFRFSRCRKFNRDNWALLSALTIALTALGGPAHAGATSGTVRVIYPDGLTDVMQRDIAPAFEQATGNQFIGNHAPSTKLASEIRKKKRTVDVLICANPQDNLQLMGKWVDWYAMFIRSPLVVGYDPASKFADQLSSIPWYQVAAESDFRLGLSDPNKDSKGRLIAKVLHRAVKNHEQHDLENDLAANSQIVPAQDLRSRLRSHEIDATFFYQIEAAAADIPSVPVNMGEISTTYTVTILNHAPNPGSAAAFVTFLIGREGQQILKKNENLTLMSTPVVFGNLGAVPGELKQVLNVAD